MYAINPAIPHVPQVTQYDCWHAALRMMVRARPNAAANAEPQGTFTDRLYNYCRMAQNGYNAQVQQARTTAENGGEEFDAIANRHACNAAKQVVSAWAKTCVMPATAQDGTVANKAAGFDVRPGLTIALAPAILAENRMRAVRGNAHVEELDGSAAGIEAMLQAHGPLYLLVSFGHVVVVTGIDGDQLTVNDPLMHGPSTMNRNGLVTSPCVARLM